MKLAFKLKSPTFYLFLYFFFLALAGSLLFQVPFFYKNGHVMTYIDSLFITVSAICVTGLSTVDMKIFSDFGFILLLFLIEAGGLGLVSFFSIYLLFSEKKISLVNRNIIYNYVTKDSTISVRGILKRIIFITLAMQFFGAFVLFLILHNSGVEKSLFHGIFISISAFCNAGFSPYSNSLIDFSNNWALCFVVCFLIITGGLGYFVIIDVWEILKRKKRHLTLHAKIVLLATAILIALGTFIFFIFERKNAFAQFSSFSAFVNAFFESVTLRTAGFETVPQKEFSALSTFVSFLLMIIGGSPGSMAGGIKTTTIFLLIFYVYRSFDDKGNLSLFKRDIAEEFFVKAVTICVKSFSLIGVMFFCLLIAESKSIENGIFTSGELFFESISAFCTIGLTKGITSDLSSFGKLIIIVMMFAGRTGITFIALKSLAGKKSVKAYTNYPKEDILIG